MKTSARKKAKKRIQRDFCQMCIRDRLQSCTKRVQTAIIIYRISASGYIVFVKDMAICIE